MAIVGDCRSISRKFTGEQRARGGVNRARKVRASRRVTKTRLLDHLEAGCSKREAARREGLAESTARGILANAEIVPIVPNLHSPAAVPRWTDRNHASRQRRLTPARVAGLWDCYRIPRETRDIPGRVYLRKERPHRPVVEGHFGQLAGRYATIQILAMHRESTGEWCAYPPVRDRLVIDDRPAGARSGVCSNRFLPRAGRLLTFHPGSGERTYRRVAHRPKPTAAVGRDAGLERYGNPGTGNAALSGLCWPWGYGALQQANEDANDDDGGADKGDCPFYEAGFE